MRRSRMRWSAMAAALCGLLLLPRAVVAQGEEVDDATRDRARELFREGRQAYQEDRAEEAMELLRQSYELLPSWATSNGMALCEEKLERPAAALRLYERALREGGGAMPDPQRAQIQQRVGELRRSMNLALLSVLTTPPDAQVFLDGAPLGPSPFEGDVPSGAHTLTVRLEGYELAERTVELGVGEARTVDVTLVARAGTPDGRLAGDAGRLDLSADGDGYVVLVDGESVGTTPLSPMDVAAGERLVRVEAGDRSWEERVAVTAGETVRIDVRLGGGLHQGWFWGLAGTAAAAGIGMAVTGGLAFKAHDDWEAADPADRAGLAADGELYQDLADGLLGVAGATAIAALVVLFFTDFDGEPTGEVFVGGAGEGAGDGTTASGGLWDF